MVMFLVTFTVIAAQGMASAVDKGPPRLVDRYQSRYVAAIGSTIRLICPIVSEHPESGQAPLYDWVKDGREIHAGWPRYKIVAGTLRIKEVDVNDAGEYRCQATNGFGSARATMIMHVTDVADQGNNTGQAMPAATANISNPLTDVVTAWATDQMPSADDTAASVEALPFRCSNVRARNASVRVGDVAVMHCELQCNSSPNVQWLKHVDEPPNRPKKRSFHQVNGELISFVRAISRSPSSWLLRDGRIGFTSVPPGTSLYVSRLTLNATTNRDSGMYVCVSVDKDGQRSTFGTAYLTVVDGLSGLSTRSDDDGPGVISSGSRPSYDHETSPSLSMTFVILLSIGLVVLVVVVLCLARRRCHRPAASMTADKMFARRHLVNAVEARGELAIESKKSLPFVVGCPTTTTPSPEYPSSHVVQQSANVLEWQRRWRGRVPRGYRWSSSVVGMGGPNGRSTRRHEPVSTPLLLSWYSSHDGDVTGLNNGRHNVSPGSYPLNVYEA